MPGETGGDVLQPRLAIGQGLIEELPAHPAQSHGMVTAFADFQTGEHVHVVLVHDHRHVCYLFGHHPLMVDQRWQVSACKLRRIARRAWLSN